MDLETEIPGVRHRLDVGVRYDDADPLVVSLVFDAGDDVPISWAVCRDLLLEGLDRPSGLGDVHVRPADDGELLIVLRTPSGTARLHAPAAALESLLLRTLLLVPIGAEFAPGALERELDILLPPGHS
ncbi:SsgA family sporulation/cell division regulator [Kitasatospora mediocidica]|uniref:SsgA family sporulation/cell division regulator n=1 Tax=Kitasatospora mediocidica TaxID=58352 RepID=UPI00068D6BBB|nr:SsgA family sporulation/cell division regulator [Kitasatospora mediocidica]